MNFSTLLLGLISFTLVSTEKHHQPNVYEYGDQVQVECVKLDPHGNPLKNPEDQLIWMTGPYCLETQKTLFINYGKDDFLQCSFYTEGLFYRQLQIALQNSTPLKCRIPTSKDENPDFLPLSIQFISSASHEPHLRLAGTLNAVFHGKDGYVVAGSIYSALDRPAPVAVEGVSTIHISTKWFEGYNLRLAMNELDKKSNISSFLALMFCILTSMITVTLAMIYYEHFVIPSKTKGKKAAKKMD